MDAQGGVVSSATASNASYVATTWDGDFGMPTIGKIAYPGVNNNYFGGDLTEMVIFGRELTEREELRVINYLLDRPDDRSTVFFFR